MKIVAIATLMGEDRKLIEPGTVVDLPSDEAKSLVARGLASLPAGKKPAAEGEEQNPAN